MVGFTAVNISLAVARLMTPGHPSETACPPPWVPLPVPLVSSSSMVVLVLSDDS